MRNLNLTEKEEETLFWEKETIDINGREIDEEEQQFWQMVKLYITSTLGIVDLNTQRELDNKLPNWRNHVYQETNLSEELINVLNLEFDGKMPKIRIAQVIYLFTRDILSCL